MYLEVQLNAINKMHFLGEKAFIFNLRSDVKMQKENVHQIKFVFTRIDSQPVDQEFEVMGHLVEL